MPLRRSTISAALRLANRTNGAGTTLLHAENSTIQTSRTSAGGARFSASAHAGSGDAEEHKRSDVMAASGMDPIRNSKRKLTIYAVPKTAMQSGSAQTLQGGAPAWRIVAEVESKWANPLLGWTSTADPMETTLRTLTFFSKEEAAAYCDKMGYKYEIEPAVSVNKMVRPKKFQAYGNNFGVNRLKGGTPIGGLRSEQQQEPKSRK